MSTIRVRDVKVETAIAPDQPVPLTVSFEQHPSGALRCSFEHRGRWEMAVSPGSTPAVSDARQDRESVRSVPAWVERVVRSALEEL